MALYEYYDKQIPDYYPTMYRDGYSPEQIRYALHRKMVREYQAREARKQAEAEQSEVWNVKITSEVKIK